MKNLKTLLAVLLLFCTVFCLFSCTGNTDTEETTKAETTEAETTEAETTEAAASFKVTVVDGEGNAVPGVMMQVCKDSCIPARTDDNGVATFAIEITDGYKLSVLSCPEGYEYTGEAEIYLESGATEYTVEISKVN